jgi:putative transposase
VLKKLLTPGTRKQAVTYVVVGLPRASYDYKPVARDDAELREKIRELAHQRRRFGCPRIHLLLRRGGLVINHKRTERIYREEGLSLRKRKRRKTAAMARVILPTPLRPNERWSMDLRQILDEYSLTIHNFDNITLFYFR